MWRLLDVCTWLAWEACQTDNFQLLVSSHYIGASSRGLDAKNTDRLV
jgi:hypothetical protein